MPYKQKTCRSDWAAFVFQSWRRRWCTTMCARIRRSCRAWSTQVFIKQTLQLSVSSKDAYRPWKPRGATSVPAELTCVTKRCVRVLLTWNHFIFCGPLKKKKSCIFQAFWGFFVQGKMYRSFKGTSPPASCAKCWVFKMFLLHWFIFSWHSNWSTWHVFLFCWLLAYLIKKKYYSEQKNGKGSLVKDSR